MPAVMIGQMGALARILDHTATDQHRLALLLQAEMIRRAAVESVPEPADRVAVEQAYDALQRVADPRRDR